MDVGYRSPGKQIADTSTPPKEPWKCRFFGMHKFLVQSNWPELCTPNARMDLAEFMDSHCQITCKLCGKLFKGFNESLKSMYPTFSDIVSITGGVWRLFYGGVNPQECY